MGRPHGIRTCMSLERWSEIQTQLLLRVAKDPALSGVCVTQFYGILEHVQGVLQMEGVINTPDPVPQGGP